MLAVLVLVSVIVSSSGFAESSFWKKPGLGTYGIISTVQLFVPRREKRLVHRLAPGASQFSTRVRLPRARKRLAPSRRMKMALKAGSENDQASLGHFFQPSRAFGGFN